MESGAVSAPAERPPSGRRSSSGGPSATASTPSVAWPRPRTWPTRREGDHIGQHRRHLRQELAGVDATAHADRSLKRTDVEGGPMSGPCPDPACAWAPHSQIDRWAAAWSNGPARSPLRRLGWPPPAVRPRPDVCGRPPCTRTAASTPQAPLRSASPGAVRHPRGHDRSRRRTPPFGDRGWATCASPQQSRGFWTAHRVRARSASARTSATVTTLAARPAGPGSDQWKNNARLGVL